MSCVWTAISFPLRESISFHSMTSDWPFWSFDWMWWAWMSSSSYVQLIYTWENENIPSFSTRGDRSNSSIDLTTELTDERETRGEIFHFIDQCQSHDRVVDGCFSSKFNKPQDRTDRVEWESHRWILLLISFLCTLDFISLGKFLFGSWWANGSRCVMIRGICDMNSVAINCHFTSSCAGVENLISTHLFVIFYSPMINCFLMCCCCSLCTRISHCERWLTAATAAAVRSPADAAALDWHRLCWSVLWYRNCPAPSVVVAINSIISVNQMTFWTNASLTESRWRENVY